jgi:hypothetical protein
MKLWIRIFIFTFYLYRFLYGVTDASAQSVDELSNSLENNSLDSISLCMKITDYQLSNDQWVDTEHRTFSYNESNILTEYSVTQLDQNRILNAIKIFNTYNRRGRLIGQTGQRWVDGVWIDMNSGCHMEYDKRGNRVRGVDYVVEDSKEKIILNRESVYDKKGNEILIKTKKLNDSTFVPTDQLMYRFDDRKQLAEKVRAIWNDDHWVQDSRFVYLYDDKGRIAEESGYKFVNLIWVNRNRKIYHYDENTKTSDEILESFTNEVWIKEIKVTTHLDVDGNIQKIESAGFSSASGWRTDHRVIFKYTKVPIIKPQFGNPTVADIIQPTPKPEFRLDHNYPNPFNATAQIHFFVPFKTNVSLKVYDILGREIATLVDEEREQGEYSVMWDGSNVASGVYFYRMEAGEFSQVQKMNLIK